jgi:hypothetical protein
MARDGFGNYHSCELVEYQQIVQVEADRKTLNIRVLSNIYCS